MTDSVFMDDLREKHRGKTVRFISAYVDRSGNSAGIKHSPPPPEDGMLVWTINGWWMKYPYCSLGFEMHDFGGPSYDAMEEYKEAYIEQALRCSDIPVFMPRESAGFPNVHRYPIEEVLDFYGIPDPYFGESPNYAIALAGMWGVKRLDLWGFYYPFGYPKAGERASTEFWIGMASGKTGMQITIGNPQENNLLTPDPWEEFYHPMKYGYRDDGT